MELFQLSWHNLQIQDMKSPFAVFFWVAKKLESKGKMGLASLEKYKALIKHIENGQKHVIFSTNSNYELSETQLFSFLEPTK